ncbi:MAG: iron-sulfur cluster assembly scaffold protein [Dehalococcoidales bacterium]|nr:iron-sulfur cluster assembly scaffold protein [Dehalococcoidales bacterium]
MSTAWDNFQEMMKAEMEKVYSKTAVDYIMNPRNLGHIEDADVHASATGPCGDNMDLWLKVRDEKIENASFCTDGCGATVACGGMATEMARGKTLGEALDISAEIIACELGGLPEDHAHCAGLASLTLKRAVIQYKSEADKKGKKTGGRQEKTK